MIWLFVAAAAVSIGLVLMIRAGGRIADKEEAARRHLDPPWYQR